MTDERVDDLDNEPGGAKVYDRPERGGGRSSITWILILLVIIALVLWLVL